jgi:hypothetical protein
VHYMHYHMISQSGLLRVAAVLTMLERVQPVMLSDILAARTRLAGQTLVTPVVGCQAAPAAGAIPVAAALSGRYEYSRVCAIVSGGNLDSATLSAILQGGVP